LSVLAAPSEQIARERQRCLGVIERFVAADNLPFVKEMLASYYP